MFNFALTTGRVGSTCSIWLTGFDFLREFHCKDFVHQWFLFNCRASTLLYDILLCFLVVEIDDITAERWSSLPFRSDSSTTQLKQFWSRYVTGQNYKVNNAKVPNDKFQNLCSQAERTFEIALATAPDHPPHLSLGLIRCFGLLQTSVLRLVHVQLA